MLIFELDMLDCFDKIFFRDYNFYKLKGEWPLFLSAYYMHKESLDFQTKRPLHPISTIHLWQEDKARERGLHAGKEETALVKF